MGYQNNYPQLPNHSKINENLRKTQKMSKKHIKSKEKRPKANASSHNACRFGYPFFLSPSDDDAMLEIPNPTPSVHQTFRTLFVFLSPPKKKKTTTQQNSPEKKNSKTSEKRTLHIYPKSPKFQEYQNNYPKLPNHSKINENL